MQVPKEMLDKRKSRKKPRRNLIHLFKVIAEAFKNFQTS